MITEAQVIEALKTCYDPEIPVSIVDLGLIYGVDIQGNDVHVRMTMTARGCPMHAVLTQEAKQAVEALDGVGSVDVELVWDPPWTPERLSDEAKKRLGFGE